MSPRDDTPREPTSPYPGGLPGHHGATDTEATAAVTAHEHATNTRIEVVEFLHARGELGATDHEGEQALSMFSYQRRRTDLSQSRPPLVVDSGRRRLSPRGRPMVVWIHASFAVEQQSEGESDAVVADVRREAVPDRLRTLFGSG